MATYPLSGRVALVTGAARGIGLETARLLHARGASVVLVDLDAAATRQAAVAVGERTLALDADVTDRAAMEAVLARALERFGGLDVVVANAGIAPAVASLRGEGGRSFERVIEVNLLGVWRTVSPALEHVVARQGQVVVISSVYAFMNGALQASYAASKAAVEQLGRSLRVELAGTGASATVAHFGFVETAMVQAALSQPPAARLVARLPGFMQSRLPASTAAAGVVRAIERRAPRVILPRFWAVAFRARGMLMPLLDRLAERDENVLAAVREADSLSGPDR